MSEAHIRYEKKKRRIRHNGIFYAVTSSASFGFSPLFSLGLLAIGLTNFDVLAYRWGIAGIVLMIYAMVKKKSLIPASFDEIWKMLLLSSLRAITSITLLIGYANISSGIASTINFMYPVIVALTMMFVFGEHKSWVDMGAIAVAIFGVYLLASGDSLIVEGGNTELGLTCSIISAFSFAAYYILMKKLRADKIEVVKFNTWVTMLISIYFIACALIFEDGLSMIYGTKNWMYMLGLGLWSTMISNFTGVKAVRRIGPTLTSILGALQPVTAVILGVTFLHEHLYMKSLIGIIMILCAVCVVVLHQNNRKHV